MQIPLSLLGFVEYLLNTGAPTAPPNRLELELRHFHASSSQRIAFNDVPPAFVSEPYSVKTRRVRTPRPSSFAAVQLARKGLAESFKWEEDEVDGPDAEDRETLLTLAKMTSNAYARPKDGGWYDLGSEWNTSFPVGWEPDDDGFRGYVFASPDNSTVVLSIKGTSIPLVGGGPTTKKDKLNDNLLFSCCCARVDWSWSTVCGCYRGQQKCDQNCLETALVDDSLFYTVGTNLYNNLTYMYPEANIWLIGHSLGGALASLLGATFGTPVVAFEAPGERMAAKRLHLPSSPSLNHITHVYNTADPIPNGVCTGVSSSCGVAGYALETKCHLGRTILYDTVTNLSWAVDVRSHRIGILTDDLLAKPWPPAEEMGREVPIPKSEDDCVDCFKWDFGDYPASGFVNGTPSCGY